MVEIVIITVYILSMLCLCAFGLGQIHLTWVYSKTPQKKEQHPFTDDFVPAITVQLPIYNEKYVVSSLIDQVAQLDYPKDKLEIQILDDSTDETTDLIEKKIKPLQQLGWEIKLIHRQDRLGFKAGALEAGLQCAKGEFIAIFDADFRPQPAFLKEVVTHFKNKRIGAVQVRWGHTNENYSLMTRAQAFGLNAHFSVEQIGRSRSGSFIHFNGTCGMWRKKSIIESGGWSADTLTEDLDLSYRAQMHGWKIKYLPHIETPGELPFIMQAVRSQQYRWSKGSAETARKHLGKVLKSVQSTKHKIHAFFHLLNAVSFILTFTIGILSVPVLYIKHLYPDMKWIFDMALSIPLAVLSISFFIFYWVATKHFQHKHIVRFFFSIYPWFLIFFMGLSLQNSLAVIEGLMGRKTPFVRTPKFNLTSNDRTWKKSEYLKLRITPIILIEGLIFLYFLFGLTLGIYWTDGYFIIPQSMYCMGFGFIFYHSVKPVHGS